MKDASTGYVLHGRLGYKVFWLARLMQGRLERGLARLMWCVLVAIADDGVETPSELAGHFGITWPATLRLLREMEARSLLRRNGHEGDGHRRLVLTPRGHGALQAARQAVAD
jgi:DNA-binding MarR family transcriptional regulator